MLSIDTVHLQRKRFEYFSTPEFNIVCTLNFVIPYDAPIKEKQLVQCICFEFQTYKDVNTSNVSVERR